MRKLISSFVLLLAVTAANGQTTATNWTAPDCAGLSHTLFDELDSGKVIVFAWVMPCGTCIDPAKTAYDVVQTFAVTHPGKVRFYMADDFGNTSCGTLAGWAADYVGNTGNMTLFGNAGVAIDEDDFGGTGMPHIIVMGGSSHQIFFNKKNGAADDAAGITTAINAAIGVTGISAKPDEIVFEVAPNPATALVQIRYGRSVKKIVLTDVSGKTILEQQYPQGSRNPELRLNTVPAGTYLVRITDMNDRSGIRQIVKQ